MFTREQRGRPRDLLAAAAEADVRIVGAAVTGSAAIEREDRWSDIDLVLRVAAEAAFGKVIVDWTEDLYAIHAAVDHLAVIAGPATYRVLLLASTPQVDLAFWPETEFGLTGPKFRLVFGAVNAIAQAPGRAPRPLMHRTGPSMTGGVHDQRRARLRFRPRVLAPWSASRPGPQKGPACP
jgi:hypothetical protein